MEKISLRNTFKKLKAQKRSALIAYLTAGYPSLPQSDKAVKSLEKEGVDILEIGVPFSDPIADGPTIQFSSQKALERGITLRHILSWVSRLRKHCSMPIVLMTYMNPIHSMGAGIFAKAARRVGVNGVIVPDLIPEEAGPLSRELSRQNIDMIYLVAPTTPVSRQRWIAKKSRGFLYAVSVTGVTGARKSLPQETVRWIKKLRSFSKVPVALGFGISSPKQVKAFASHADGLIFGSVLIDTLRRKASVAALAKSFRRAADSCKLLSR